MSKEEIYDQITLKHLGNNPNGTRMDIVYEAMEQYAKQEMTNLLNNISKWPIDVYSEKVRGQDKKYYLGRTFVEGLIKRINQ